MLAVISDVHGNLDALEAVLSDVDAQGVDRIICLGDILGYGPNPIECLDAIIERCDVILCGNHDHAVLYEPLSFHLAAENACYWTRRQLESEPDVRKRNRRWDALGSVSFQHRENGMMFVHGSPRKPINEYLFPEDVFTYPEKLAHNFNYVHEQTCFVGHTHVAGVFWEDPYFDQPGDLPERNKLSLSNEKSIINVGSVGQPRDRDVRSSYVTVEDDQVAFHRVEYDIDSCVRKIQKIPELDNYLGQRLYDGR
jgi:diadenosine tetraphosphatase ApaH/serine/threonine PP2A family protein phosphatase